MSEKNMEKSASKCPGRSKEAKPKTEQQTIPKKIGNADTSKQGPLKTIGDITAFMKKMGITTLDPLRVADLHEFAHEFATSIVQEACSYIATLHKTDPDDEQAINPGSTLASTPPPKGQCPKNRNKKQPEPALSNPVPKKYCSCSTRYHMRSADQMAGKNVDLKQELDLEQQVVLAGPSSVRDDDIQRKREDREEDRPDDSA